MSTNRKKEITRLLIRELNRSIGFADEEDGYSYINAVGENDAQWVIDSSLGSKDGDFECGTPGYNDSDDPQLGVTGSNLGSEDTLSLIHISEPTRPY